jgi:hypothetical protein
MSTAIKTLKAAGLLSVALLFTAAGHAETADGDAATGSWQQHKYTFNYMGFTSIYSCNGLEDKLRLLLQMSGAGPSRHDVHVSSPCVLGLGRPDKLAMADLTFSSLQPAASGDGAPVGVWRHVALTPHHPFEFERGDCELIEEFRDKVLPMFTTRNLVNNVTCVPHQDSGSDFNLSYDVFAPPPVKPAAVSPAAVKKS